MSLPLKIRDHQQILLVSFLVGYLIYSQYLWKLSDIALKLLTGFLIEDPLYCVPVHTQLLRHMLECLFQTLLEDHLLEASGASLVGGNTIQRLSEYLRALGTPESTDAEDQIHLTLKAPHIPNTAFVMLMDVLTHIPAARTDTTVEVNTAVEFGFLFCLINSV